MHSGHCQCVVGRTCPDHPEHGSIHASAIALTAMAFNRIGDRWKQSVERGGDPGVGLR
jgi:hypothetical protein